MLVVLYLTEMIKTLFSSHIYHSPINRQPKPLIQDLLEESFQIQKSDLAGQKWSQKNYIHGFTSYGSMDQLHRFSTTFEKLQKAIDRHVEKYIKALELDISPKDLRMSSCWVNIMPPGAHHSYHLHPLSVISGTFYVQTPKNCSAIKFEDPRLAHFMASPPRRAKASEELQPFVQIPPQAGDLVLFESWMKHEVPPNQSKKERVSISFNYEWRNS